MNLGGHFRKSGAKNKVAKNLMIAAGMLGFFLLANQLSQPQYERRAAVATVNDYLRAGPDQPGSFTDLDRNCLDNADLGPKEFTDDLWRQVQEVSASAYAAPLSFGVGSASIDGETAVVPVAVGAEADLYFDLVRRGRRDWRICDFVLAPAN